MKEIGVLLDAVFFSVIFTCIRTTVNLVFHQNSFLSDLLLVLIKYTAITLLDLLRYKNSFDLYDALSVFTEAAHNTRKMLIVLC